MLEMWVLMSVKYRDIDDCREFVVVVANCGEIRIFLLQIRICIW